ncbi:MAG: FG-GAP repeat protein [Chloroflexi bacterium]|nr:FG-GAP repeat protein [Chloroflexota bacterium]
MAFALPDTTEAASFNEIRKLQASDAEDADQFGFSVAVSEDTALVGANHETTGGSSEGAVYVFQRDAGGAENWGEVKKLAASDANPFDNFGFSVAADGDTVIVGALFDGGSSSCCHFGAAYVFQRDEGGADNWGELKKLAASDAEEEDHFGWSVAVSGDTVVVGAASEDAGGRGAGAVYVFYRDRGGADNWGEVAKLTASDSQAKDQFGVAVGVSGQTAIVGAWREDAGGSDSGAAYVFQRDEGGADNWGEVEKVTASDAQEGDQFGFDVAVSGQTAVVGASHEDAGGSDAGAAYVFQRDEGGPDNWGEVEKLTASNAETRAYFGESVALSSDALLVGAWSENLEGNSVGAAYVFQRDLGGVDSWGEAGRHISPAGGRFGSSVAIRGDTAIVGAYSEGDLSFRVGAAYVFDLFKPTPVGGLSLDPDLRSLPLETTGSDRSLWSVAAGIVTAVCLVAVGGAAWYARRRASR